MDPKKILIVAGEPSGDLHASNLVKDLKRLNPHLKFFGLGGSLSKKAGVDIIFDISGLALIGAVEVLKNIFVVKRAYNAVISKVDSLKPDFAILVDYPGFNLRLAMELKKRSIPVIYYISPQVWAWGRDRIDIIRKAVKKILVFFKFEEELYKKYDINVEFVGHPVLDIVKLSLTKEDVLKKYNLSGEKITISLLPGSRAIEVKRLLPVMVFAGKIINEKLNKTQFIIVKHSDLSINLYERIIENSGLEIRLAEDDAYNVLSASDFAIVASGTATLESAAIGTPLVIIYKVNLLTFILYKLVSNIQFLGLINIIAQKEVAPELLQSNATPEKIANKAIEILSDENKILSMRRELKSVRDSLGSSGASLRAARSILNILEGIDK